MIGDLRFAQQYHNMIYQRCGPGSAKISEQEMSDTGFNLFRAVVEQAPDAIIFADREGTVRAWNRGAEAIFGYAAAEVLGASLDVIIPERFRRAHWEGFRRAIDSGRTKYDRKVLTTRSLHKDGSTLYVDLSFGLIRDEAGAIAGALAIGRDCTARHRSETALRSNAVQSEQIVTHKDHG
jgi:PAS domain S-box-containing protein